MMKKALIIIPLTALMIISCSVKPMSEGSVVVDLNQKGAEIPPSMYGVFFEEINHGGDGGLYAELVQNRSFEEKEMPAGYFAEGDKLHPEPVKNHITGELTKETFRWNTEKIPAWSLESAGNLKASMELTKADPLKAETPVSLCVTVSGDKGSVSLMNSGYWGMGVRAGEKYNLRFFIRSMDYKGSVKAALVSEKGDTLALGISEIKSDGHWNEYKTVLTPSQTDGKAKLALVFGSKGKMWIDFVSLFPENTFKNRPNGLRKDVAEFLEGLHPAFIRWPGGCIVEGISLKNRVEWKKTLGDPAARPGQYDTWGYRNTYGLGYYEYLQYCEDIGAKAMFVCNVGLGCQYRTGDACRDGDVQYYINDVLDAIEYATGDKSTAWGAKRAEAGHPEPFPLQYIEIGNENWGPVYNKRCDMFYKAIKARYPSLTLISDHGLKSDMTGVEKVDMIDPHWYVEPDYFFQNTRIFDTVPRGKHLVYVGEYACNQKVEGGNMLAALSEAAFITGMERNSDLVKMASYAPLFENRHDRTWPVNLIWIDNLNVIGRSSYYVQKVMAENKPSWNVRTVTQSRSGVSPDSTRQFSVAGFDKDKGEIVIKVVNAEERPWNAEVKIMNGGKVQKPGEVVTLSSASLKDENSYDGPSVIVPVKTEFSGFSEKFTYEFKPCSLTVLRIKVE